MRTAVSRSLLVGTLPASSTSSSVTVTRTLDPSKLGSERKPFSICDFTLSEEAVAAAAGAAAGAAELAGDAGSADVAGCGTVEVAGFSVGAAGSVLVVAPALAAELAPSGGAYFAIVFTKRCAPSGVTMLPRRIVRKGTMRP